jgi:DNA-binding transcriptional LysR family regulator
VRLATTDALAIRCIRHVLLPLHERYPSLVVDVVSGNRVSDLSLAEADVSLRVVRPTGADLVARRIGSIHWAAFASHHYVKRRGRPRHGEELGAHDVVHYSDELATAPEGAWLASRAHRAVAFKTSSVLGVLAALVSGYGVGILPLGLGAGEPELVHLFDLSDVAPRALWLVTHRDTRRVDRVRVLADHLSKTLPDAITAR